jgi:hypothetical protein
MNGHRKVRKLIVSLVAALFLDAGIGLPTSSISIVQAAGTAQIRGAVYVDLNLNGVKDDEEECSHFPASTVDHFRCSRVVLILSGTQSDGSLVDRAIATDDTGGFGFTDLNPGTYTLCEVGFSGLSRNCRDGPSDVVE